MAVALGLGLLATAASADWTERAKRELPAKSDPVEKLEPRARAVESARPSPPVPPPEIAEPARPAEPELPTAAPGEPAVPAEPEPPVAVPADAPEPEPSVVTGAIDETPAPVPPDRPNAHPRRLVAEGDMPPPQPRREHIDHAFASAVRYSQPPAVDGVNAKAAGFGGGFDGRALYGGEGSLAVPLSPQYGFQIDGVAAGYDSRLAGNTGIVGFAAHVFWRDPTVGLLGLYGHYIHADAFGGTDLYAGGVEGAVYSGRWTLEGIAGVEGGDSGSALVGGASRQFDVKTRFFDVLTLAHYPSDDLRLTIGHSYTSGRHALDLGAEWGLPMGGGTMTAVFAQATVTEGGDAGVLGGVRFYFGQRDKPLMARHREDDPTLTFLTARSLHVLRD